MNVLIDHYREPGTESLFEYHCWESHNSTDAHLWYRSHQRVKILHCLNAREFGDLSQADRYYAGLPLVYRVRFADDFESDVFEDELVDGEQEYVRPDPPTADDACGTRKES